MQPHDVWQEYQPNSGNVSVVLPEYPHGNCYPHEGEYSLLLEGSDYSCSGYHTAAAILTLDLSQQAGRIGHIMPCPWCCPRTPTPPVGSASSTL